MRSRFVVAALVVACGGGEPEPLTGEERIEAILELEGKAEPGGVGYDAHCAACHGPDGSGAVDDEDLGGVDIRGVAVERVVEAVVEPGPGMLTFDTLPDQDVADIAAFVGSL